MKDMKLFGFTFIRTKELEEMREKVKQLNLRLDSRKKLFDAVLDADKKRREQDDVELRKWCVDRILMDGRHWICGDIEFMYRYVTTGDTAIFQDLKEYREWKAEKREAEKAKAEEAQKSAKESHQQ